MFRIYSYLINFFFPVLIFIIYIRTFLKKEDKKRFKEKLFSSSFNVKKYSQKKLIWFHVASIGELKSIIPLLNKLANKKELNFLITTVTLSSSKLIETDLKNHKNITHRFFPIDKPNLVKSFIENWSPELIIFVDSEIWPNFIFEIRKNKIPLILLNARITKKTFLRWMLIKNSAQRIFRSFKLCIASNKESQMFLEKLKVDNIKYYGNLKLAFNNNFDNSISNINVSLKDKKFWCALSTHKGEDIFCLNTHIKIKKIHDDIVTIIIPRHIDRVQNIKSICEKLNLKTQVLSQGDTIEADNEIIIINSYGVTSKYLKLCKSVFIGKSLLKKLKNVGGQNPIEAAKIGCKIYHGPYVYNFQEIYELLNKNKISELIKTENELSNKLVSDLNKSNLMTDEKIQIINNLGREILDNTYNEIIRYIK